MAGFEFHVSSKEKVRDLCIQDIYGKAISEMSVSVYLYLIIPND